MMVKGNVPFWQEGRKISNMPTKPGDYRPDAKVSQDYAKMMSKPMRKRDAGVTSIQPDIYTRKQLAKKAGGFKGHKI